MPARRGRVCRRRRRRCAQLPAERGAALYDAVYGSPFGNDLLLDFAGELLDRERLGKRNATDLLSVSFSSNDSVGHTYGPDSPQVRDIAIRTDRTIGRLLNQVDKIVGLQHTLVAFTTDHGVAPLPESLRERGLPGGRMTTKELFDPIQQALVSKIRRRQVAAGDRRLVAVPELRAHREAPARCRGGPPRRGGGRDQGAARGARLHARPAAARRCPQRPHRQPRPARLQRATVGRPRDHPRAVLDAPGAGHHARHARTTTTPTSR